MPEPIATEEALRRLLFDQSFRDAWLEGRGPEVGIAPALLEDLDTVNRGEFLRTCRRIAGNLLAGNTDQEGGLRAAYPRTLERLRRVGHDEHALVDAFMASPFFALYREIPAERPCLCVEEAFYLFLLDSSIPTKDAVLGQVLRFEFLQVVTQLIVANPDRVFAVASKLVRDNGVCLFGVVELDVTTLAPLRLSPPDAGFYLHAAVRGRYVYGPVDPCVIPLIEAGDSEAAMRALPGHVMAPDALAGTVTRLREMGLIR